MLAFVKLQITFSIWMYIICVMFVQCIELRGRHFTNCHYYYYSLQSHTTRALWVYSEAKNSVIVAVVKRLGFISKWETGLMIIK